MRRTRRAGPARGEPSRRGRRARAAEEALREEPGNRSGAPAQKAGAGSGAEGAAEKELGAETTRLPARFDALLSLVLGIGLFTIYARGACPTVYVGDSGELTTAAATLGIPHPTGYPLYVLLGKLWSLLVPAGSAAHRMSLFSAFFAALACGLLYRLARSVDIEARLAAFTALLLAFAPSFWGEANVQRVYSLNAAFVIGAALAARRWQQHPSVRRFAWMLFVCGLGASNHTFMAIEGCVLFAWALAHRFDQVRRPRMLAAGAAAFAAGLLPYLYLPIRSRFEPRLDWGNPETLERFLGVVLRRGFWERAYLETPADLLTIAWDFVTGLGTELAGFGALLAVIALAQGRRRPMVRPAAAILLANLVVMALHGSRSDLFLWHRYYIPAGAMAALLAGLGAQTLVERLPPGGSTRRGLAALFFVLPATLWWRGAAEFDRSRYRIAEQFARMVLASVAPGAHLAATDDNVLFALIYLSFVEGVRPDVDLILQGVGGATLTPLRFNPDDDALYFTHHPNWNHPALDVVPVGVVFRVVRPGAPRPTPIIPALRLDGEDDPTVPKDYLTRNLIGHFHYMLGFTFEQSDWPRAESEFARARAASPDNDVLFYNLGLIYQRNGLFPEARAAFERCRAINPRHMASTSAPRAADRVAEVDAEEARLSSIIDGFTGDPILAAQRSGAALWHRRVAELLAARGETIAARGERLRSLAASPS